MSTNGIKLNGYKLRKAAAIVMDGDEIEIPFAKSRAIITFRAASLTHSVVIEFKCVHILKGPIERMDIFEPTPPQGEHKVSCGLVVNCRTYFFVEFDCRTLYDHVSLPWKVRTGETNIIILMLSFEAGASLRYTSRLIQCPKSRLHVRRLSQEARIGKTCKTL